MQCSLYNGWFIIPESLQRRTSQAKRIDMTVGHFLAWYGVLPL